MTTGLLKRIAPFIPVGLTVVAICLVLFMFIDNFRNPPRNWQDPPIYPNAQNIRIENADVQGDGWGEQVKKRITFETSDNSSDVLAFYRKAFAGSEWQRSEIDIKENAIEYITFRGSRAPEMFTFEVSVNVPTVEIKLGYDPGR